MNIQERLENFIITEKFSDEKWEERGLKNSGKRVSKKLNSFFNRIAAELLLIEKKDYTPYIIKFLKEVNAADYDTERAGVYYRLFSGTG